MKLVPNLCICGKPARDHAYVCDDCADMLAAALGDCAWLEEQLEITLTRQRAVDYRTTGGPKSTTAPLPADQGAAGATTRLRAALARTVRFCLDTGVPHSSPHRAVPQNTLTAMSSWLMWRIDGLQLSPGGPAAVASITAAVQGAHHAIDKRRERQYLGECASCAEGRLYTSPGQVFATCDRCRAQVEARALRDKLLAELDDRLCTAAEIARLSTYLGLTDDRGKVRNRINVWAKRGRIVSETELTTEPAYRFGIVWRLLVAHEVDRTA